MHSIECPASLVYKILDSFSFCPLLITDLLNIMLPFSCVKPFNFCESEVYGPYTSAESSG